MDIKDFTVRIIPPSQTHEWLLKKHYAHRIPSISYAFGLYDGVMILRGICTFGSPCRAFNSGEYIFNEYNITTLELNRLCVEDNMPKNTASFFLGRCFQLLPKPMCLVSYSDERFGHKGYIYQATNWIYTGCNKVHDVEYLIGGQQVHSRTLTGMGHTAPQEWAEDNNIETTEYGEKHRYFKFIGNKRQISEMKKRFKFEVKNYPKGQTRRYDASYEPSKQIVMI